MKSVNQKWRALVAAAIVCAVGVANGRLPAYSLGRHLTSPNGNHATMLDEGLTITFDQQCVVNGAASSSTATVTLDEIAPAGGLTVRLTCDKARVTVPATVIVPAGHNKTTFKVTAAANADPCIATIDAETDGASGLGKFVVFPRVDAVVQPGKEYVPAGETPFDLLLYFAGATPAEFRVYVESDSSAVTPPFFKDVPAGTKVLDVAMRTALTVNKPATAHITMSYYGFAITATVKVVP